MGNMHAAELAAGIAEGWASPRQALTVHLQSNHYPPLPDAYVALAQQAIEKANAGEWDEFLPLSKEIVLSGVLPRETRVRAGLGFVITVGEAVEILHLDVFIAAMWEDED